MKVVCINNIELSKDSSGKPRHRRLPLTIGQIYDVKPGGVFGFPGKAEFYEIEDNGDVFYPSHYFVTIDVWREMQINKLI
jgi:hypothetical protein